MLKNMFTAQLLPSPVYYISALVIGGAVAIIMYYRYKNRKQSVAMGMIAAYLALVLSSTIIMRTITEHNYELMLFWSYIEIYKGNKAFIYENILNIIMLMPVGVLISIGFDKSKLKQVIITGVVTSSIIEILQLLTRRGLFEFDDILHNTVGCLLGYWICKQVRVILAKDALFHHVKH